MNAEFAMVPVKSMTADVLTFQLKTVTAMATKTTLWASVAVTAQPMWTSMGFVTT